MREQRLVFGEVAQLYDQHRPAYPGRLIDDLIELGGLDGSQAALEVGAGTGKATLMFAARGIPVWAVEPSGEMARVARRNCSAYPGVKIEQCEFEDWDSSGRRFPLLFSAQAWHWVKPAAGYATARQALSRRGILAAFWNRAQWERSDLREELLEAYEQAAPELATDTPLHPANLRPDAEADWAGEINGAEGFGEAEVRYYEWDRDYSAADFIGLLTTITEVRRLDPARRTALFAALSAVIDRHGQQVAVPMRTRLCLARVT